VILLEKQLNYDATKVEKICLPLEKFAWSKKSLREINELPGCFNQIGVFISRFLEQARIAKLWKNLIEWYLRNWKKDCCSLKNVI
jgi:hypothetical protein